MRALTGGARFARFDEFAAGQREDGEQRGDGLNRDNASNAAAE